MEDRSAAFNNAGVSILMLENGYQGFAMELFRGALEAKLAFERSQLMPDIRPKPETPPSMGGESFVQVAVPSQADCITQAEIHLENLDLYLSNAANATLMTLSPSTIPQETSAVAYNGTVISIPRQMRGYEPYICKTPMTIADCPSVTLLTSSMIVFNLGLVHQLVNRESPAAAEFYEISITLMPRVSSMTSEALLFRLALLNNFGVWCFENGDGDCMLICVEQLTVCLEELDLLGVVIDAPTRQGIETNVMWLLTPLNGGSPAA